MDPNAQPNKPPAAAPAQPPAQAKPGEPPKQPAAAAPPPADPPAPPPDPLAPKLARVAEREAQAELRVRQLEADRKAFDEERKTLAADAAEAKRLRSLKGNALAFARELGMTPAEFLEAASKGDATDPAVVAAVEELRSKTVQLDKQLEERGKQDAEYRRQQQSAQYHGRIQALMEKGADRWDFAREEGLTPEYVLSAAITQVRERVARGQQPPTATEEEKLFEEICDKAEAWAIAKLKKQAAKEKWAKEIAGGAAAPAAPAAKPGAPATLQNNTSTKPAPAAAAPTRWTRDDDMKLFRDKHPEWFQPRAPAPRPKFRPPAGLGGGQPEKDEEV